MVGGSWYDLARDRLVDGCIIDIVSQDSFISVGVARGILGQSLRVPKRHQDKIISELVSCGYLVRVNKRLLRVVERED